MWRHRLTPIYSRQFVGYANSRPTVLPLNEACYWAAFVALGKRWRLRWLLSVLSKPGSRSFTSLALTNWQMRSILLDSTKTRLVWSSARTLTDRKSGVEGKSVDLGGLR